MKSTIYALIDPRTEEIRYIGNSVDPRARLRRHINKCSTNSTQSAAWVRELVSLSIKPKLVVLQVCDGDGCEEEKLHIEKARVLGARLTNVYDGGEMSRASESFRSKLRECATGKRKTKKEIEKRVAAMLAKTPEEKAEIQERKYRSMYVFPWTETERQSLIDRRKAIGASQVTVAIASGIHEDNLMQIENGDERPRHKTFAKIIAGLKSLEDSGYCPEMAKENGQANRTAGLRAALAGKKQSPEQVRLRKEAFAATMARNKLLGLGRYAPKNVR